MLHVSTNNRADAALTFFCGAVHEYGVPSRVLADGGSEFRDINLMINFLNGDDRARHTVGLSYEENALEEPNDIAIVLPRFTAPSTNAQIENLSNTAELLRCSDSDGIYIYIYICRDC